MQNTPVDNYNQPQDTDPVDETPYNTNWGIVDGGRVAALTQAQINALTAQQKPDGRVVWNITSRVIQHWDNINGVWVIDSPGSYKQLLGGIGAYTAAGIGATAFPLAQTGKPVAINAGSADLNAIAIRAADFVSGALLNLRAWIIVAGTAPGQAITFDLRLVTIAGGSAALGAAIAGSSVTIPAPALNTITDGTSGDFALPADGVYVLTVRAAALTTAGSYNLGAALRAKL